MPANIKLTLRQFIEKNLADPHFADFWHNAKIYGGPLPQLAEEDFWKGRYQWWLENVRNPTVRQSTYH